jgi:hypothetical protein
MLQRREQALEKHRVIEAKITLEQVTTTHTTLCARGRLSIDSFSLCMPRFQLTGYVDSC